MPYGVRVTPYGTVASTLQYCTLQSGTYVTVLSGKYGAVRLTFHHEKINCPVLETMLKIKIESIIVFKLLHYTNSCIRY